MNPDALNDLRESPHIGGLKKTHKRTECTVNVDFADGSIGRKSVNQPVEALKLAIRSVMCSVTKSKKTNNPIATWRRDSLCTDMGIDKAIKDNIITFPLAGIILY